MNFHEKRIHTRIDCNNLVEIKCIDSDGQISSQVLGQILDISKGGVKIKSPLPVDTELILISTLDTEKKSFGIRGKIAYSAREESGGYSLGIKFEAPEKSCMKFIKAVMTSHLSMTNSKAQYDYETFDADSGPGVTQQSSRKDAKTQKLA